eukprot:TRINITY_DN31277_c0_g1_i1.p1 TRINITY_DN31277_c0_g1~~TRINITY_DN31277_c0_g1_i1.p1  ORF type:complete len:240 (+),score=45.87 TRINITY_DN31277_c0_g1_i1:41-721(+)
MTCTVYWHIKGQARRSSVTGDAAEGMQFAELMSQLRTNLATPEGFEILITDSINGDIIRSGLLPNGCTVSVQGVTSLITKKAETYKSLDGLFMRTPRISIPTDTDVEMKSQEEPQQQLPVLAEPSVDHNPLYCPISQALLIDAVIVSCCGNTCSQAAIRADLPCPFCKSDTPEIVPDARVRRMAKKHQEEKRAETAAKVASVLENLQAVKRNAEAEEGGDMKRHAP